MKMVFLTFPFSFEVFEAHFHIEIFLIEKKNMHANWVVEAHFLKKVFLLKKTCMQTEINFKFIAIYSSFQQNNFIFFLSLISASKTLKTGRIYKNSNLPSNSLVDDFFYCNHNPRSKGV